MSFLHCFTQCLIQNPTATPFFTSPLIFLFFFFFLFSSFSFFLSSLDISLFRLMKIQASTYNPQTPPLASHLPPYSQLSSAFALSATTSTSSTAPSAAGPPIVLKQEKQSKRRRRATANSHFQNGADIDPASAPKRRKHQKVPSASSNSSTPSLPFAPVPTPPLSTASVSSSLANPLEPLQRTQNSTPLQKHIPNPSPRPYPNILANPVIPSMSIPP